MDKLEKKLLEKFGKQITIQYNGSDLQNGEMPPIEISGKLTNLISGRFTIINENHIYKDLDISEIEKDSIQ